jgi:hypothetical protein
MSMPKAPAVVVFGGERVAGDADRFDHRFGRKRRAFETVHADDDAGTGNFLELPPHLGGVVRERVDLLARERRSERGAAAIGGGFGRVLADDDVLGNFFDGEHERLAVVAGAQLDVLGDARRESGKLDADVVAAWCEAGELRDADWRRRNRLSGRASDVRQRHDRHGGARDDSACFIHHGNAETSRPGRLRQRVRRHQAGERRNDHGAKHQGHRFTSNRRGSIFALMRKPSKLVSSAGSDPTARLKRKGQVTPSTVR